MKDAYARYTFSIGLRPGCDLTDKGYDALEDALDSVMTDALDEIYDKVRDKLPADVDDAVQMNWKREE